MDLTHDVLKRLAEPFDETYLQVLPGATTTEKDKALVSPYLQASAITDRLNDVVGAGWTEEYVTIERSDNAVVLCCRLTVLGITRVGYGQAKKESELDKSAESDALKRAATKFGIGTYLRRLPNVWWPCHTYGKDNKLVRLDHEADLVRQLVATSWTIIKGTEPIPIKQPDNKQSSQTGRQQPRQAEREQARQSKGQTQSQKLAPVRAAEIAEKLDQHFPDPVERHSFLEQTIGRVCEPEDMTVHNYALVMGAIKEIENGGRCDE